MIAPIVKEPNPLLHQKAVDVQKITLEIQKLVDTMIETMHAAEGVGLAANQIGSSWNILVASADGKRGKELVLINPAIRKRRGRDLSPEGCLSVPGVSSEVLRSAQVTAAGLTRKGETITVEANGLLAKILQHEVDHLQGHLFLYRLGLLKRRRLLQKYLSLADTLNRVRV
ncbi:MAG: peptide deformylase [Candidatus Omnitrophica bacterium]|nr:peptide deformylase [Candidatus Omnitrophota bacterium]